MLEGVMELNVECLCNNRNDDKRVCHVNMVDNCQFVNIILTTQRETYELLNDLITSKPKGVTVLQENCIPVVITSMENHSHDLQVQKEALVLLEKLCSEKFIQRIIVHSGSTILIMIAMSEFDEPISLVGIALHRLQDDSIKRKHNPSYC